MQDTDFDSTQASFFDSWAERFSKFEESDDVFERLERVCKLTKISVNDQVLDVGTGCGIMIGHLLNNGCPTQNIFGVDLSAEMLQFAARKYPSVKFFKGNFLSTSLETFDLNIPFSMVVFNACFGNFPDPHIAVEKATSILQEGGRIVISHPLGADFVRMLHGREPHIVPHLLPNLEKLEDLCKKNSLKVQEYIDESEFYLAVLSKPLN